MSPSPFVLTGCAASIDGSVSLTGVVTELEDQDVAHVILWERIAGTWKSYQWNNRCHGVAMYPEEGRSVAVYLGREGTLKVRSQNHGSSEQRVDSGDDAPSSLRSVSAIRVIEDRLFVVGMRRMVYQRGFDDTLWLRADDGLRQARSDTSIAGLRSIDGLRASQLVAVGLAGEIWSCSEGSWRRERSPTDLRLAVVRCIDASTTVVGGANGVLLVRRGEHWSAVEHDFRNETFIGIERLHDRVFVCSEAGTLFELSLGARTRLEPLVRSELPRVHALAATSKRVFFVGSSSLWSLGDDGWRDESPPPELLSV